MDFVQARDLSTLAALHDLVLRVGGLHPFLEAEAALEGELDGVMALFGHRSIKSRKKGTLNNWLETAAAPTIWICNSLDRFDPATLRRMTLSLQIDAPPPSIRSKLAKAELQAAVSEPLIDRIAKSQSYMPADLKRIAKAAKLTGGMMDDETAATVASATSAPFRFGVQSAYTKRHQTAASAMSKVGERPSGSGMSAASTRFGGVWL